MKAISLTSTTTRSAVLPLVLRGAQREGVVRIADVSCWLSDAGLPSSTGTVHNLIQADEIDAAAALVVLERMPLDTLAYGAARAAGGTFRRAGNGTGNALAVSADIMADMAAVVAIFADGRVDAHERDQLFRHLMQARDQIAGLIEQHGGDR